MAAALGRMLRSGWLHRDAARMWASPVVASPRLFSSRVSANKAPAPAPMPDFDDMDEEGFVDGPASVQRRVLALKKVQEDYDGVNREYLKELATLQAKYMEKYQPFFDARREVVLGNTPVDKFEVADDGEPDKGIPEFWITAFMNHEKVGAYVTERDMEVLRHLVDVRSAVLTGDDRGFEITFHFSDNEFLASKTLTKRYVLQPEEDVIPKDFVGCEVVWKSDKANPTVEERKKRVKGSGKGKPAFTIEKVPCESFFNFFDPPKIPLNPENLEDDELEALQEELSADFDIGFAIKDQIIPRAVEWFTGELAEPFDDDMYDEGEFEDMEEEEPEPAPRKGGARR